MRDKYIAGILIILSMAVFITGLNWGLPSEKLNGLYFSKEEHLTKHISELKETELPRFFYNPIRTYHPDEYFILKCLYMIKIPDIFNFSQFSIGGAFLFLYGAILFILYKLNFISITKDIAFYFLHPEKIARMYIVGRFICVLYGTGIVILTYFLTKKIFKSKIAGFFSSFLLIFSPLFLLNAHYMYVDIPGVFWMMILLFFCVKYINGEKINPLIIGFLSGMSAGNKLTFILTFFIPLITFMMIKEEPRKKIKNISLSFLSFSITLFLTTPYLFSALFHLFHAEGKHATKFSFIPGFYILCLRYGLGFPLFLLLLSGLFITFLFERNISSDKKLLILWILFYFFTMSCLSLKFARYILPVIPPFIIIGTGKWFEFQKYKFIRNVLIISVGVFTFVYGMAFETLFIRENVRTEAGLWIKENIKPQSDIGVTEIPWQFQLPPFDYYTYPVAVSGYRFEKVKEKRPLYFILSSFQAPIPPYPTSLEKKRMNFYREFIKSGLYREEKRFERYPSFAGFTFKFRKIPEDMVYVNPTIIIFKKMNKEIFDYNLPKELIAQYPLKEREKARLMVVDRKSGNIIESIFEKLDGFLQPGEVIVLNDSKVIPARLYFRKETGGKLEVFLLRNKGEYIWEVLIRGKIKPGRKFYSSEVEGEVLEKTEKGSYIVRFNLEKEKIKEYGEIPLPPYIKREPQPEDMEYYQTVYAKKEGSVAAPTAGLHFTEEILKKLEKKGVKITFLTLHIGWASFKIIRKEEKVDEEFFEIPEETAEVINEAKRSGKRIIAVGTSCVRALESAEKDGKVIPFKGFTNLFIKKGHIFKIVDALITNFHLPNSTHLYLVCAFAGKELMEKAYKLAVEKRYRFYSYGDAMFII